MEMALDRNLESHGVAEENAWDGLTQPAFADLLPEPPAILQVISSPSVRLQRTLPGDQHRGVL